MTDQQRKRLINAFSFIGGLVENEGKFYRIRGNGFSMLVDTRGGIEQVTFYRKYESSYSDGDPIDEQITAIVDSEFLLPLLRGVVDEAKRADKVIKETLNLEDE